MAHASSHIAEDVLLLFVTILLFSLLLVTSHSDSRSDSHSHCHCNSHYYLTLNHAPAAQLQRERGSEKGEVEQKEQPKQSQRKRRARPGEALWSRASCEGLKRSESSFPRHSHLVCRFFSQRFVCGFSPEASHYSVIKSV
jgi:hypothetical protein